MHCLVLGTPRAKVLLEFDRNCVQDLDCPIVGEEGDSVQELDCPSVGKEGDIPKTKWHEPNLAGWCNFGF